MILANTKAVINLPISGIALGLVGVFLRVRTPKGSLSEKFRRIDYVCVRRLLPYFSS